MSKSISQFHHLQIQSTEAEDEAQLVTGFAEDVSTQRKLSYWK